MSLLLTVYNTPAWKTFVSICGMPIINEAAPVVNSNTSILLPTQSLPALTALLPDLSDGQIFWLAVVQAEHFIADALESGGTLAEAAQAWEQQTNALLRLQQQQRKKLQLFNVHQALAQPTRFRLLLTPEATIHDYPEQNISSNLSLLAACQYLTQHPELQALNIRLQASVLPLCDSEKLILNIDQILLQSHINSVAADAYDQAQFKLKETREERDLILAQLQQVQEQIEQYYLTLQAEQQNNKHTLLARDAQQAKEITKLEADLRKTKARAANAEYTGLLLQQELDKLRKSISWKAATPVRVLGRLVRKSDPERQKLMQDIGLLLTSEYFDVDWYLRTYTDVAESQVNPAEHYLLHGAAEGRLPGPLFDGNWYLQHYPDVGAANMNPLLHFILYGQQEGRNSSPILLTNHSQDVEE